MADYAEELSGRRVRIPILNDEESPKLAQTLSDLLEASETSESEWQQLIPSSLSENTGEAFIDVVVEKYREQGFNL